MKLEFRSIVAAGDLKNERITMRAQENIDLGEYAFLQVTAVGGDVSQEVHNAYWFPYQDIERGDLVVLYTKTGSARSKKLDTGKTAHFFYLGQGAPIWLPDDERAAVILYAPQWISSPARDISSR